MVRNLKLKSQWIYSDYFYCFHKNNLPINVSSWCSICQSSLFLFSFAIVQIHPFNIIKLMSLKINIYWPKLNNTWFKNDSETLPKMLCSKLMKIGNQIPICRDIRVWYNCMRAFALWGCIERWQTAETNWSIPSRISVDLSKSKNGHSACQGAHHHQSPCHHHLLLLHERHRHYHQRHCKLLHNNNTWRHVQLRVAWAVQSVLWAPRRQIPPPQRWRRPPQPPPHNHHQQ